MMHRRTTRVNYPYLNRLFAALDRVGIDPKELPPEFARMAWEAKMNLIKERYNVSVCVRCKLPYPEDEMDLHYNLCKQCASTMHSKSSHDPRVLGMLFDHHGYKDNSHVGASDHERIRKLPTSGNSATEVLDRISKRGGT